MAAACTLPMTNSCDGPQTSFNRNSSSTTMMHFYASTPQPGEDVLADEIGFIPPPEQHHAQALSSFSKLCW